ncbi:MAG: DNA polymerase III subunit delta' [Pseudomonadota bacterium]
MTDIPEPDRVGDAPHPRETDRLFGQEAAEAAFLDAWNGGRLHHGWLLTGPQGVGKATLSWRIARFLLTNPARPANSLAPQSDHPALVRIAALSEPRLMLLRRPWDEKTKRLRPVITVEEARRLGSFFGLSSEGRRVVIVDAADELNPNAANAILKLLEEPPDGAVLLLISHRPQGLLPTIRSRCRVLRLAPLVQPDLMAAAAQAGHPLSEEAVALAEGSVGAALDLSSGGAEIYVALLDLLAQAPMDRAKARRLADACGGRATERLDQTLAAIARLLHRAARAGLLGPPADALPKEGDVLARMAPHDAAARVWANLSQQIGDRAAHAQAVNVDGAAIVWDALAAIDMQARSI